MVVTGRVGFDKGKCNTKELMDIKRKCHEQHVTVIYIINVYFHNKL